MSDKTKNDAGSVHYHYHFYGTAPQNAGQPQPGQQNQAGPAAAFPGWPPNAASAGNAHQHPNADALIKGLAVGAGAAWLLGNEKVQRGLMRTAFQLWATLQGGMEEMKERMQDAEAEVAAEAAARAGDEVAPAQEPPAAEAEPVRGPRPVAG